MHATPAILFALVFEPALQKKSAVRSRHTLLLNISACNLKLALKSRDVAGAKSSELLQEVVHHCTEIIDDIRIQHSDTVALDAVGDGGRHSGSHATKVKALYRRAQAHMALGNSSQAARLAAVLCGVVLCLSTLPPHFLIPRTLIVV